MHPAEKRIRVTPADLLRGKVERKAVEVLLRRMRYIGEQCKKDPTRRGGDFRRQEFHALEWVLSEVAGRYRVTTWLEVFEIALPAVGGEAAAVAADGSTP